MSAFKKHSNHLNRHSIINSIHHSDPGSYDDGQHNIGADTDYGYGDAQDDTNAGQTSQTTNDDILFDRPHTAAKPLKYKTPSRRPQVEVRSRGAAPQLARIQDAPPAVVQSQNASAAVNRTNEQRLLDLYSVHGGVTEVEDDPATSNGRFRPVSSAARPPIRARVISVTPSPDHLVENGASEQSSVRRVVVSKPFETVEHVEIPPERTVAANITKAEQQQLRQQRLQLQQRFVERKPAPRQN